MAVREKQLAALRAMLGGDAAGGAAAPWKVLVYCQAGEQIIAPLLNVGQLRELGVTLHLRLAAPRDPVPDVPAVYCVMPSKENIERICRDLRSRIYDSFEFFFISNISRSALEDLAAAALDSDNPGAIAKVQDMYMNFICLEENMFCLQPSEPRFASYTTLNSRRTSDTDMETCFKEIADGLLAVLVTMGVVPVIRASRGHAAEQIAALLDRRIRELLNNPRGNPFDSSVPSFRQRPLLCLIDRNLDISTILHHTWTYQALVHDVLGLELNQTTVETEKATESRPAKVKTFDLNDKLDSFWSRQRGQPFPEVASAVEEELAAFKQREAELKQLQGGMGADEDIGGNTEKLTMAITSLPQLLEKKRLIDMHTTLLTTIMASLQSRKLDQYFELEEQLMNHKSLTRPVAEHLADAEAGTAADRLRLYIIYFMTENLSEDERRRCERILESQGCDLSAIYYLEELKKEKERAHQPAIQASHKSESLFQSHVSSLLKSGEAFWSKGVKKLLPTSGDLPITRIVKELVARKPTSLTKDYVYFNPKMPSSGGAGRADPGDGPAYEEAIVFMVGGGNYTELTNLETEEKHKIVYGATELLSADGFLDQLHTLGAPPASAAAAGAAPAK